MRISRGRLEPCNDNFGGIKSIFIFSYLPTVADQLRGRYGVSLISYPSTRVYKYEVLNASFTENRGEQLGEWSQSLSATLPIQSVADAVELEKLIGIELGVIILNRDGRYRLMGAFNGCNVSQYSTESGGGGSDLNGYTISIEASERYKSPEVLNFDASGFADNDIIFLANNFEARVLADSGIFEARECLIDLLRELEITNPIAILANSFNNRVIEDSGEFESKQCLFETLQEINIL